MRTGTVAAAFVLCMQTWVAAQDTEEQATPPLGPEAYKLLASFYEYDRDIPLEVRIGGRFETPDAAVEKIVFRSRDSRVPAFLAIPKTASPPYPCVLALHGLGPDKMNWWEDDNDLSGGNLTKALLRKGIAVLTPDVVLLATDTQEAVSHTARAANQTTPSGDVRIDPARDRATFFGIAIEDTTPPPSTE